MGQMRPGTTSIEKVEHIPFSQVIGICIIPTASSCESGLATETDKGVASFLYERLGHFWLTNSAWVLLTILREQQESKGRGSLTPADVTGAHKICQFARLRLVTTG